MIIPSLSYLRFGLPVTFCHLIYLSKTIKEPTPAIITQITDAMMKLNLKAHQDFIMFQIQLLHQTY